MLTIVIEEEEVFNDETEEFGTAERIVLNLEHSLISLSKWESKHSIPFLDNGTRTTAEILSYIQMMIIDPEISPGVIYRCSDADFTKIQEYIDSPQSATTFGRMPDRHAPSEVITSELIYYWMTAFQIPFECQHWHLNRLFSLIRICNLKNAPEKKMSRHETALKYREINAQRRAELGTKG